jgi:hypothetical protein|tara:strand:- start:155 stop:442 length:288 start_codon:yes stop_codon:yes gene_type:complete
MNRKKSKRISKHARTLQLEWVRSLLSDEEASKINMDNLDEFLPEQTHLWARQTMFTSFYTKKWLSNKIKQLLRIYPDKEVEDITSADVAWKAAQR